MYLYTTDFWYQVPTVTIPFNRSYIGTVIMDANLFVVGGFDGIMRLKTVVALDLEHPHNGWRNCAPMAEIRCFVSTLNSMYVSRENCTPWVDKMARLIIIWLAARSMTQPQTDGPESQKRRKSGVVQGPTMARSTLQEASMEPIA